ncbi:methyl-accepting chemotaxis protein [Pullulanibacillus pueri]|uniref:Methyl-accepting chemotaxis protein n=1 Tax=Pullulanibacillus pueri TaxID=1437324 RepID=A0A8J3ENJ1_9BACL|nr:methyl-accepting chemotaxis protein [Pullulanibacillus pueri]MBM7683978.1 methyl-accepting chemotaxis protein [Pullulanibacillus pueri]GGH88138.1 hypothetical protein GCM10007096_39790 [Pullulanibacillus pueri]
MNWTFRRKIAVILIASLAGILIISAFMVVSTLTQNHENTKIKNVNEAVLTAEGISKSMETARKNDQNFLLEPSEDLEGTVEKNIDTINNNITQLEKANLGISKETEALKKAVTAYSSGFKSLSATEKVIGYDEQSGKLGSLNDSSQAMTRILNSSGNEKLTSMGTELELAQANFTKDFDEKSYNTLTKIIDKIDAAAKQSLSDSQYNTFSTSSLTLKSSVDSLKSFNGFEADSLKAFEKNASDVTKTVDQTVKKLNNKKDSYYDTQATIQKVFLILMIILGLLTLITLGAFGGWLYRTVSESIRTLRKGAVIIGDGNLSYRVPIKGKDEFAELAQAFNQMASSMESTMTKVTGAAESLSSSSQNLAAISEETNAQAVEVNEAVQQVAIGAQNQAEHLEESMALLTKVSGAIHETSSFSEAIGKQSNEAQEANQQGLKVVSILEEGSTQFLEIAKHLISDIQGVAQQSTEIISILKVIKDISSNTDLLALNAAIESARAGEAGRGFAVVSHEIRKLAERSKKETGNIEEVIGNIIHKLNGISQEANKLNESLSDQDYNVKQTKAAFDDIDENVVSINSGISNIKAAIQNVNEANSALSTKLEEISAISEETAASTEQVSASSESQTEAIEEVNKAALSLQDIALILEQEVAKFEFSAIQDESKLQINEQHALDSATSDEIEPVLEQKEESLENTMSEDNTEEKNDPEDLEQSEEVAATQDSNDLQDEDENEEDKSKE